MYPLLEYTSTYTNVEVVQWLIGHLFRSRRLIFHVHSVYMNMYIEIHKRATHLKMPIYIFVTINNHFLTYTCRSFCTKSTHITYGYFHLPCEGYGISEHDLRQIYIGTFKVKYAQNIFRFTYIYFSTKSNEI